MKDISIRIVEPLDAALHQLIKALDEELLERYPAEEVHGLDFTDPGIKETVFIVAFAGDEPVGCGAIRPLDAQYTELKRFFVRKESRKLGIAAAMLFFLEDQAQSRGFAGIRLETGPEQPESLKFYEKHGYVFIGKFGEYVDYELSMCYEKLFDA
ncbi:Ribosomal protein S18 acetylase RimI [Paenibacillus algorifonticola]|uniref:Ribosomal protein S18 acetylase RimI n=1 Tax=Paenibacillus algorifonticola TaxID=684063 RepID=A0A1I2I8E7_9BACL|nr:GNAT family N-acetyltransferase [Paenibacillus algorifonticola]SFF37923.1 Ribosomal protein S18 acetylase RimI [Paenibacillus algorifonticola]